MGLAKRVVSCCLFLFALAATIVFVVGFATSFWVRGEETSAERMNMGLWERCIGEICSAFRAKRMSGWLYAVQALECFGLMGVVTTLMLASTLACGLPVPKTIVTKIVIILSLITAAFISLGVVIIAVKTPYTLAYSFTLTAVSSVLMIVVALLTYLHHRLSEWR